MQATGICHIKLRMFRLLYILCNVHAISHASPWSILNIYIFFGLIFSTGVDRSTIVGYTITILIQMWGGFAYNLTISATITYFVSVCYYIRACCNEINHIFDEINRKFAAGGRHSIKIIENDIKRAIVFHIKIIK